MKGMNFSAIRRFGGLGTGALLVLFGALFLFAPELSGKAIVVTLALLLLLIGGINIALYFMEERYSVMEKKSFTVGVVFAAVGILLLLKPNLLISFLPTVWGCVLLLSGIVKTQTAMDLRRMAYRKWFVELVLGVIGIVLGVIVLENPFGTALVLTRFTGASLLVEGITNCVASITMQRVKRLFYADRLKGE